VNKSNLLHLVLALFLVNPLFAQNKKNAQSLLWRITGNGLQKPSYLYGTVHLRNKQLFNFGDSLYKSLENVDAFAMELDPEEMSSAVVDQLQKNERKVYLKDKLNKADFDKLKKRLRKEYNVNAEDMTVKEFYSLKERLILPEGSPDDMSTFMDAYLYSIAKGQGKPVVGLEDIQDQLDGFDEDEIEDVDPRDVKQLFRQIEMGRDYVKQMLNWYLEQDIESLQVYSQLSSSDRQDTIFMKRNQKMASRFDSLIRQNESYFVAVGAAHLAGDHGVISLMNRKGYTVEPVYSSRRLPASAYTFKKAALKWQEVNEPTMGYSIMMPGKASASEMLDGEMKVRMYYDMANGMVYYASFMRPANAITDANKDSLFNNMVTSSVQNGAEIVSRKNIERYGMPGVEIFYRNKVEDMYMNMQIIGKGRKLYMLMMGAQKRETLDNGTNDFFNSFKLIADQPVKWTVIPEPEDAFKMSWPLKPEVTRLSKEVVDSSFSAKRYMSALDEDGLFFFLLVSRTIGNFIIPNDSLYFDGVARNMKLQRFDSIDAPEYFSWNGYPAMNLKGKANAGMQMQLKAILRGNRVYTVMAMYEKDKEQDPQIAQFMNSLEFTPFPEPVFRKINSPSNDFLAELPVGVIHDNSDSLDLNIKTYYAYDSMQATTYSITSKKLSPYLWASSDTAFLRTQMNIFITGSDSLEGHRFTSNGKSNSIDFSIKMKNSNMLHRGRIILHGRNAYFLESRVNAIKEAATPVNHFFETFRPLGEAGTDLITASTPAKLFNDLKSTDSATYENAYSALEEISFTREEIPLLFNEAITPYREDTFRFKSVNTILFDKLAKMNDPSVLDLTRKNYFLLTTGQEKFKYELLRVLSSIKTSDSYKLMEEIINQGLPKEGNAARFLYPMHDSLALSMKVFPSLLKHIDDSLLAMPLSYLQQAMLDSNLMKPDDIRSYRKAWIDVAGKRIREMKAEDVEYAGTFDTDLVQVLLSYKDKEANNAVAGFLPLKPLYLKRFVAVGLLKNGVAIESKYAEAIAADRYNRIEFYEELLELGKEKLFPQRWLTQQHFAESYLFGSFDDEEPTKVTAIGERLAMFKGRKQRFFLYKLEYAFDDEKYTYLGVSGPFNVKATDVLSADAISGVVAVEYDQKKIAEHFKNYLSEYEGTESAEE
jgi:uncharacterized protein YbaP (TraB family)